MGICAKLFAIRKGAARRLDGRHGMIVVCAPDVCDGDYVAVTY
jgi:hypothetical protein